MMTLPACRLVFGEYDAYAAEFVARRPGGDLDAVLSVTTYDRRAYVTYLAFRRSEGLWRPLAGLAHDIEAAIYGAEHEQRFAGWDSPELQAALGTLRVSAA